MLDGNDQTFDNQRQYINALKGHLFIRDLLFLPDKDMVSNDIFIIFILANPVICFIFTLIKNQDKRMPTIRACLLN
jgi:hypothetical protein